MLFLYSNKKMFTLVSQDYSYRIIVAGLILIIRYDGQIIIKSDAIKLPALR